MPRMAFQSFLNRLLASASSLPKQVGNLRGRLPGVDQASVRTFMHKFASLLKGPASAHGAQSFRALYGRGAAYGGIFVGTAAAAAMGTSSDTDKDATGAPSSSSPWRHVPLWRRQRELDAGGSGVQAQAFQTEQALQEFAQVDARMRQVQAPRAQAAQAPAAGPQEQPVARSASASAVTRPQATSSRGSTLAAGSMSDDDALLAFVSAGSAGSGGR